MSINFVLATIDWTAIGAIATALAVIAAFVTIYSSIRQNRNSRILQIRLIKQQQAQQRLDDMVNNVLNINYNMNPFHIMHYSNKLTSNSFTAEDRQALEKLAVDDNLNSTNLNLQLIRLNNYTSAKSLLNCLNRIRADYGLWSRTVNSLFQFKCFSEALEQQVDAIEQAINIMKSEMVDKLIEIDPRYRQIMKEVLQSEEKPINQALAVLQAFEAEIARYIQKQQGDFEKKLTLFVKSEQQRIDDMIPEK